MTSRKAGFDKSNPYRSAPKVRYVPGNDIGPRSEMKNPPMFLILLHFWIDLINRFLDFNCLLKGRYNLAVMFYIIKG